MTFWDKHEATGGPLTADDLTAAMRAIEAMPPHPCRLGQHLISPKAKQRGYGICVECKTPVGQWPDS
jgi:hypothetical protein